MVNALSNNNKIFLPSNDPLVLANSNNWPKVSKEGLNTKTPELKQSGHPGSGAADNSSR